MAEPVTSTEDFETFYRRAWRDAARWATALTGNQAIGEEIAQDAFVKLSSRSLNWLTPTATCASPSSISPVPRCVRAGGGRCASNGSPPRGDRFTRRRQRTAGLTRAVVVRAACRLGAALLGRLGRGGHRRGVGLPTEHRAFACPRHGEPQQRFAARCARHRRSVGQLAICERSATQVTARLAARHLSRCVDSVPHDWPQRSRAPIGLRSAAKTSQRWSSSARRRVPIHHCSHRPTACVCSRPSHR